MRQNILTVGDTAPQFEAVDVFDVSVNLADQRTPHVLLVFLRYSGCPWCNLAIHRLALEYRLLKKSGCEVIAFVQSDKRSIESNIYQRHSVRPPFHIIPDNMRTFYNLYGVKPSLTAVARSIAKLPYWLQAVNQHGFRQTEIDGNLLLVPATFLINTKTQTIVKAEYGTSFYDHDTFTTIYEQLVFERI